MALIDAKVVADAVKEGLRDQLVFSTIGGVVVEDKSLEGLGTGSTKVFPSFEFSEEELQVLQIGDEIETKRVSQDKFEVTIEHLAFGKKYFKAEQKKAVGGKEFPEVVTEQIIWTFQRGLDNLSLAAATDNAKVVDASAGVSVDLVLSEAEDYFGEKVYSGDIPAFVIHPKKAKELRNDPDFEPANKYTDKTYGNLEIGRLYGVIPVILANRVMAGATQGTYKNLLVEKGTVLSVLGMDLDVQEEFIKKQRSTEITADMMVGIQAVKKGLVFEG